ncbi:hypothetical protein EDB85DRAFT_2143949 [Lactarius pseudohatsudake]|nr:hypothetical protein EDB85DRAFT_2143949 [Lactarius pseudohatsudake]
MYTLMANYILTYFIEGKEIPGAVIISKSASGVELRRAIYDECSPSFWSGARAGELILLQVDMENTPHIDIQDLRGDGGLRINPGMFVDEIWPEQPNRHRFHMCVKFPGVVPQKRSIPQPQPGDVYSADQDGRESDGLMITMDDDVRVLKKTLDKM